MRRRRLALAAVWTLLCAVLLAGCSSYGTALQANWGLRLPAAARCRQVYEADSGPSFHGDGLRCHVFSYENEEALRELVAWSTPESGDAHGRSYCAETVQSYLAQLAVPEEQWPELAESLLWWRRGESDTRNELLLVLDGAADRLWVVESFL